MVRNESARADGPSQVKYEPSKRADIGYIMCQGNGQI